MSFKNSFIVSLVFLLGVVFLVLSVPQDSRAGVPIPVDSNCCFAHGGVGCESPACEDTVCSTDPFCCGANDGFWDDICAGLAEDLCGDLCEPTDSDCCEPHGGTGCNNASCEEFICGFDSFCCEALWDPQCADEANQFCAVCGGEPILIRPIPTLNQWGLIALAGIMGLAALYILIRRRPFESS